MNRPPSGRHARRGPKLVDSRGVRATERAAGWLVAGIGLAALAGLALDLPAVQRVAAVWNASPAPRVFTERGGLESFSTAFALEWRDADGAPRSVAIDRSRFAGIEGPWTRRAVLVAVLIHGPRLASGGASRRLWADAARHAFCGEAPVLRELGIDPRAVSPPLVLVHTPREGSASDLPLRLEIPCG
jgi:hypothetical protein